MAVLPGEKLETILVVDANADVLDFVGALLKRANFHVLHADSGGNALKLAADYAGRIDLLLSELQMPEMSGPDLGEALKTTRPGTHVMLMSGFPGGH
jgi:two-component system, cell cycle sensor histidine kinase and response regulator CckA